MKNMKKPDLYKGTHELLKIRTLCKHILEKTEQVNGNRQPRNTPSCMWTVFYGGTRERREKKQQPCDMKVRNEQRILWMNRQACPASPSPVTCPVHSSEQPGLASIPTLNGCDKSGREEQKKQDDRGVFGGAGG